MSCTVCSYNAEQNFNNGAEGALYNALTYEPCDPTKYEGLGALGKVHNFGNKWIVSRENFGNALLKGIIESVRNFVLSIFHTLWALTAGKCFTAEEPRRIAAMYWTNLGHDLVVVLKAFVGVFAPKGAEWLDSKFMTLHVAEKV